MNTGPSTIEQMKIPPHSPSSRDAAPAPTLSPHQQTSIFAAKFAQPCQSCSFYM